MVEAFINKYYEYEALTSVKSESAEEYKTQVVIPIEIRHKNYCDLNGKIIPTEFILDKGHFFYGGYGYIVLHDFANNSEAKWISVEDSLPEVHIPVIVSCEHGVTMATYTSFPNGNSLWWAVTSIGTYEDSTNADNVTHWMPLPTPPNQ